jgi:hypothetical protein
MAASCSFASTTPTPGGCRARYFFLRSLFHTVPSSQAPCCLGTARLSLACGWHLSKESEEYEQSIIDDLGKLGIVGAWCCVLSPQHPLPPVRRMPTVHPPSPSPPPGWLQETWCPTPATSSTPLRSLRGRCCVRATRTWTTPPWRRCARSEGTWWRASAGGGHSFQHTHAPHAHPSPSHDYVPSSQPQALSALNVSFLSLARALYPRARCALQDPGPRHGPCPV